MKIKSYNELTRWKEIMKLLPDHHQINHDSEPEEVFWNWKGNKIHIDYFNNPQAKIKVIMLHGVGGNGRLLSFLGVPLYLQGVEVIAPDLPGYGISHVPGKRINWAVWRKLVVDLIDHELEKDDRPIVLFGLSAGGMLAYQAACLRQEVAGLIFSNILDQRNPKVLETSAIHPMVGKFGVPILKVFSKILPTLKIPMKFVANTRKLVNDEAILKLLITDKHSAGASVPLELIASIAEATPAIEPEAFTLCPALLVHPGVDRWTPVEVSRLFFDRLNCPKRIVMLENAGHFPVEQPGLSQMEEAVMEFLKERIEVPSNSKEMEQQQANTAS
mgnify:CR=1 FL=1